MDDMDSSFGWVDFGEDDRRSMLDMLDMFRETETRDELGIGTIRDTFSDFFFPGTSTIQTRPKYMLLVPWIYKKIEDDGVPTAKIAKRAKNDERKLIFALLKGKHTTGVIGKEAKEKLKRYPSSVYWSGLGSWGIRRFSGSIAEYYRSLDRFHKQEVLRDDDKEIIPGGIYENWDPNIPRRPKHLFEKADLLLTKGEAEYLRDRILNSHPSSLLSILVTQEKVLSAKFFWALPVIESLDKQMRSDIRHAQYFSETMHGAALLYNLMLSEECENEGWVDSYKERMEDWASVIGSHGRDVSRWHKNIHELWQAKALDGARISHPTSSFVGNWCALVASTTRPVSLPSNRDARRLIQAREHQVKRSRARLKNPSRLQHYSGYAGDDQLKYRWDVANRFVSDILKGLKRKVEEDA